jgi:enterochelin esterase-like enzyme
MADVNMRRAITYNNATVNDLSEEVVSYVSRVVNIAEMDDQFWADFILGASLWGITAGYVGAW